MILIIGAIKYNDENIATLINVNIYYYRHTLESSFIKKTTITSFPMDS